MRATTRDGEKCTSGFIGARGRIITARHFIFRERETLAAEDIQVVPAVGPPISVLQVVSTEEALDIAILHIQQDELVSARVPDLAHCSPRPGEYHIMGFPRAFVDAPPLEERISYRAHLDEFPSARKPTISIDTPPDDWRRICGSPVFDGSGTVYAVVVGALDAHGNRRLIVTTIAALRSTGLIEQVAVPSGKWAERLARAMLAEHPALSQTLRQALNNVAPDADDPVSWMLEADAHDVSQVLLQAKDGHQLGALRKLVNIMMPGAVDIRRAASVAQGRTVDLSRSLPVLAECIVAARYERRASFDVSRKSGPRIRAAVAFPTSRHAALGTIDAIRRSFVDTVARQFGLDPDEPDVAMRVKAFLRRRDKGLGEPERKPNPVYTHCARSHARDDLWEMTQQLAAEFPGLLAVRTNRSTDIDADINEAVRALFVEDMT